MCYIIIVHILQIVLLLCLAYIHHSIEDIDIKGTKWDKQTSYHYLVVYSINNIRIKFMYYGYNNSLWAFNKPLQPRACILSFISGNGCIPKYNSLYIMKFLLILALSSLNLGLRLTNVTLLNYCRISFSFPFSLFFLLGAVTFTFEK